MSLLVEVWILALQVTVAPNAQPWAAVAATNQPQSFAAETRLSETVPMAGANTHRDPAHLGQHESAPPSRDSEADPVEVSAQLIGQDRATCLRDAYPDFVEDVETDPTTGRLVVVMHDGARIPWDDGVAEKSFDELLNSPDLEDTLSIPYTVGPMLAVPEINEDPGRIRVDAFLRSVYGHTRDEVEDNLVEVVWMPSVSGRTLRFNRRNGAAEALARVSEDLEALPPRFIDYVAVTAGTFTWRNVRGTERPSAHSYGIAIDIDTTHADFWRWRRSRQDPIPYRNQIPFEIVEVFERHGFIWGGKWYHYDTMHFEYRPELLHPGCVDG